MKIKRVQSYIPIKNVNVFGYNGKVSKYNTNSPTPLPTLTPIKRNFFQKIWHNIKSFIRANSR